MGNPEIFSVVQATLGPKIYATGSVVGPCRSSYSSS